MRCLFLIVFLIWHNVSPAQLYQALDSIGINSQSENIYARKINGDSLSTSFCILIKKEVKLHKHLWHSEQVLVIQGEGRMRLGREEFLIKKGDLIFIPKNTAHAVKRTGNEPLKVLSIQSPAFDGSDRVMIEESK